MISHPCLSQVFEQSPELREVGAGLTLHANALHALRHIDPSLLDAVRSHSVDVDSLTIVDPSGREVQRIEKQAMVDRWGYPTVLVHRGELLNIMVDFARGLKNGPEITTGTRAVNVEFDPNEDEMTVVLENGSREKTGLVIGADGLHSVIREKLHGRHCFVLGTCNVLCLKLRINIICLSSTSEQTEVWK